MLMFCESSMNETVFALNDAFSYSEIPQSKLYDLKKALSAYVTKHRRNDGDAAVKFQDELRSLFKTRVEGFPTKLALFMTVLKYLRSVITAEPDLVEWFNLAIKPFTSQLCASRVSIEDAQDFVTGSMLYDDEAPDARERARVSARLASILINSYIACTAPPSPDSQGLSLQVQSQATQQLQNLIVAFGRRKSKVRPRCY